jgi:ribosomal protein L37AE/L43A
MERDQIVCIFCGGKANIDKRGNLKIVTCPMCKRETELDRYQELFEQWIGEIRKET